MDWGIIGLIDVIIIVFLFIMITVGYKKGFLKKAVGLVSFFVATIVSIVFCKQFAGFLTEHDIIYGGLYDKVEAKVASIENIEHLDSAVDLSETIQEATELPKFIANFLAERITANTSSAEVINKLTTAATDALMVLISAVLLFFIVFFGALVLKLIIHILRGNAIIKFVDGILGIVFYTSTFFLFVYSVFAIFQALANQEFFTPVQEFLVTDMMLDNPDKFRLSKYLYEHNIVYSFFEFLF